MGERKVQMGSFDFIADDATNFKSTNRIKINCCFDKNEGLQNKLKRLSSSAVFQGAILIVIFVNSVLLMLEVNNFYPSLKNLYPIFDSCCLAVYMFEFLVKVYAEPRGYWRSWSNRFDFFVLATSLLQIFVERVLIQQANPRLLTGILPVLRTLRASRALRAMRAVSFVRGLQVLLSALIDTMKKSFINVMLILIFSMFIFAIFGYYLFGYAGGDEGNWGNLGVAFLTLFSFVTVDGWFDAQIEMDERTTQSSRIFTILFIIIGHFLIFNIFISVNINNIQEANQNFHEQVIAEKEAALAKKKHTIYLQQHEDIRKLEKRQKEAECANFYEMVEPFQHTLRSDDFTTQEDITSSVEWIDLYSETLEHLDDNVNSIRHHHYELANILTESIGVELNKRLGK